MRKSNGSSGQRIRRAPVIYKRVPARYALPGLCLILAALMVSMPSAPAYGQAGKPRTPALTSTIVPASEPSEPAPTPSPAVPVRKPTLPPAASTSAPTHTYARTPVPTASSDRTVMASFEMAARHWGVPVQVLMAVGYVESRWEQRDGRPGLDDGYGIMHLRGGQGGSLELASTLTGLTPEQIRLYAQANIEGGAAVLSYISHKLGKPEQNTKKLTQWYEAVAEYSGATDPTVRDEYAQAVFRVIAEGRSATLSSGEQIVLRPTQLSGLPAPRTTAPQSDDYPPALWVPAHPNNYTVGRPFGPLSYIVIHVTEGSYYSAISWFQNPNSGVSAHYVIRSADGQITQMVRNADTAYHAGNWTYNVRSIGIEHEGYIDQPSWFTDVMYRSSAALVRYTANRYGIKKDRAHIIGHSQVPGSTHQDPGPYWNWDYYMSLVRQDALRAALVDNTDPGFHPVPPDITPDNYWWVYGGGYSGSNTYDTISVSQQQYSYNSGTWTTRLPSSGYYDVYAFIPYVDNNTPDTANARYRVYTAYGEQLAPTSQQAITDLGTGGWAHLGTFYFNAGDEARVYLDDYTGESGRNVWFDAVMWIPAEGGPPPPPASTPTPVRGYPTATPSPTRTLIPASPTPTWTPGPCGMRFNDLPDTHWAYQYIAYIYCRGVISGYSDSTFRPDMSSTRGQFSKMVVLAMDWYPHVPQYPTFADVPPDHPFYQYVETAYWWGIITGYSDGTFRPDNPVTRAQVTKMLVLAMQWNVVRPTYPTFADVPPDHWAYGYIETAAGRGVIGGYSDGTFRPGNPVTRAQLSKMLASCMQQR